jgi:predicted phage tail protein
VKLADAVKAAKFVGADALKAAKYVRVEHAKRFAHHVVPEVVRPARIIWNQAVGGIFLMFAVLFFGNAFRYYDGKTHSPNNGVALAFSVFLGAIMAYFGIVSFLKARRIGRR